MQTVAALPGAPDQGQRLTTPFLHGHVGDAPLWQTHLRSKGTVMFSRHRVGHSDKGASCESHLEEFLPGALQRPLQPIPLFAAAEVQNPGKLQLSGVLSKLLEKR